MIKPYVVHLCLILKFMIFFFLMFFITKILCFVEIIMNPRRTNRPAGTEQLLVTYFSERIVSILMATGRALVSGE